jgi:hypothetical protein
MKTISESDKCFGITFFNDSSRAFIFLRSSKMKNEKLENARKKAPK